MKLFPALLIILFIYSCKSAEKYYAQGNYEKATYAAADALKKKADDPQAQALLEDSYKKAVMQYDSIINHTPENKKGHYYDVLFNSYTSLQQLSMTVKQAAPNSNLQVKDYSADINRVAQQGAEYQYQKGTDYLQKGGKQNAQKAYQSFDLVEKYVPDFKDVAQKMQQASSLASTNIVITTFNQQFGLYSLDGSMTEQNILWQLNNIGEDNSNNFYSAYDAQMQQIRVDQRMSLTFYRFYFSPVGSSTYQYNVSKDIPSDDSKSTITVTATVFVTKRIINSRMTMDCLITDVTNRILYSNQFPASYSWTDSKARYTGDQRALGPADWALINGSGNNQPDQQFIYQQMVQQILNNFIFAMRPLYS